MTAFLFWYLLVSLLGWLTFPLTYRLLPALSDRGFTAARAAGLLLWGYLFWILASFGVAQNDIGGILLALAILAAVSVWILFQHGTDILGFIRSHLRVILTTEILFLVAFGFLAFVRSANPELTSTEKPMELAFISGIMRSPNFPPQDPWLSGYAISYYYFGYVITAMLARLTGVYASMAHNLMTALIFGLGAVGSFGILYNLLSLGQGDPEDAEQKPSIGSALLAPLFLLLVSNLEALLEVLHRLGLFWVRDEATQQWVSPFWTWLDMKELSQPPMEPFGWIPDRYLWWWRASRVIQDYDMVNGFREVIDEFPFFSFLLGDLHPHVLAIPFGLLAVTVALNMFFGGARGRIGLFGAQLRINIESLVFASVVLGGLAFLNTWDILVIAALIVSSYVIWRAREDGWRWDRLEDLFLLGLPLGILSVVLYLPFYLGFSSQAGGILPNMMYVTRGAHLWVMWGTLFIPILAFVIHALFGGSIKGNWRLALLLGPGLVLFLWVFSWLVGWMGSIVEREYVTLFLASQNMTAAQYFIATTLRRLTYIGSLITLLALLIPALAYLFPKQSLVDETPQAESASSTAVRFVFLLILFGTLLVLAPEFVYLRDQFGYRINTVFKFYYQAWMLFSLAAAFGIAYLFRSLSGAADVLFRIVVGIVVFVGLLYPVFGLLTKTNNFKPIFGYTLDDFDRIVRENPDEAAAIDFLRSAPDGILAEAVGDGYSAFARISAHTGMQTVLGWPGHEAQWRGSYAPQGSRRDDISRLYSTARWEEAQLIIEKYDIRYIYIGSLERGTLPLNEDKFKAHLNVVFQQGIVTIYEVP